MRSSVCPDLGGLTAVLKHMLRRFVEVPDFRGGIHLSPCNQPPIIFADLALLVADEPALKHSMETTGTLFCLRCSNVVDHKRGLAEHSTDFIPSTCVDSCKFRLHTNRSRRELLQYLAEAQVRMSKTAFATLEKSVGFNCRSSGLLMDELIG